MPSKGALGSAPLANIRIVEMSGLGPTPFGTMLLADLGASVLRIERLGMVNPLGGDERFDFVFRGRPAIALDLKSREGSALVRQLCETADVFIEGFRPGTMERLGLGPEELTKRNDRLIYARMSGWGQTGSLAQAAGHDINYLAMSGALHAMGPHEAAPSPPLNLVGNFGGGGTFLAIGILAALNERHTSGRGQVLDVAMRDGIAVLMTQLAGWSQMGRWHDQRGGNLLDGSAYFYRCYETSDGEHIAVGALEQKFHDAFLRGLSMDPAEFDDYLNPARWRRRGDRVAAAVRRETRAHWVNVFSGIDACVSPVLSLREAVDNPANRARNLFAVNEDAWQPSPAPRFSRSCVRAYDAGITEPSDRSILEDWGLGAEVLASLERLAIPGTHGG